MSRTRWIIERKSGLEDIGADRMEVLTCGALRFSNGSVFEPRDVIVFAQGEWITVCEEAE